MQAFLRHGETQRGRTSLPWGTREAGPLPGWSRNGKGRSHPSCEKDRKRKVGKRGSGPGGRKRFLYDRKGSKGLELLPQTKSDANQPKRSTLGRSALGGSGQGGHLNCTYRGVTVELRRAGSNLSQTKNRRILIRAGLGRGQKLTKTSENQ